MIFNCENCGKSFRAKYSAEIHKANCTDVYENLSKCECGKKFASKSTYYAHKRVCQDVITKNLEHLKNVLQYECQEDCVFKTKTLEEFLKHLNESHAINIETNQKVFNCYSEFETWKDSQEKETDAQFVISQAYNNSRGRVQTYVCNRSGKFIPATKNRKRALKSQGSVKLGFKCTSSIKVLTSNSSGAVEVTFIGHYGHKHQLKHLRIPTSDRKVIANELAEEVKYPELLRNLLSKDFSKVERKHIITKQDLKNISRQYGLQKNSEKEKEENSSLENHSEDHISVDMYVQENIQDVLLYKRQCEEEFHHPKISACPLEKYDFMLCIMTAFQREMLKKFGGDIICCDATHGTDVHDFRLITILVVDEFREAVPVAWMISNGGTDAALTAFFEAVKDNLGASTLTPLIFMSDKAPQYYNSFQSVFASNAKKLLSHWHVLKDFKTNVCSKVKKDTQDKVYKSLCALLEEPSIEVFKGLLEGFLGTLKLNSDYHEFLIYFEKEWLGIQEEWAKCFRIGAGINTDMFVESFHKKLKHCESYLNGEQGTRVDKCLSILFDFSRDLNRHRIIKLETGETKKKVSEINKRHRASFALSSSSLQLVSPSSWTFTSKRSLYTIIVNDPCRRNCKVNCSKCNICLHSYSCNCPDTANICKHIHLVARLINPQSSASDQSKEAEEQMTFLMDDTKSAEGSDILNLKENMKARFMEIYNVIDSCTDEQILMRANNSLNNIISLLQ